MKVNSEKKLKEIVWRTANEFARQNLKILLIVLHEDFGFGCERLHKVIECLKAKVKYYDEYDEDGVLDHALDRDIKGLMLDEELTDFLVGSIGSRCENRKIKKDKSVTFAEAEDIRAKMRAFEEVQASRYDLEVKKHG